MAFSFKQATRENVGLILLFAGGTGSGKTKSALRVASGMSGGKPFALIDTENRRALHYADQHSFDHADFRAPFSPSRYEEAILSADQAGYPVIVIDSFSHCHAGEGGILEMHDAELARLAGDDFKKRDALKLLAWVKPKTENRHLVTKMLQVRAHLIMCLRAEEKIEIVKQDGKTVIRPKQIPSGIDGWVPICEKTLPFEATASFLLTSAAPGIARPIKLQEQHRSLIPLDKPLDEEVGKRLAEWAAGGGEDIVRLRAKAFDVAMEGLVRMQEWWGTLTNAQRKLLDRDSLRKTAEEADRIATEKELA